MPPRSGFYVALVGLVMAGLCFLVLGLLAVFEDRIPPGISTNPIALGGVVLIDLAMILSLIVMLAGLLLAEILALTKIVGKSS
jgi:hypothetical protein